MAFVSRLEPVFVAGIAPLVLGADERPGRGLLLVLVAGLLGCGLMFGPDLHLGRTGDAALAVGGAALSAASYVSIRALSATESASAIVFWFQLVTVCAALGMCGRLPAAPPHLLPALVGSGVFAAIGQSMMARA
jgi:drug/metabolite transporter (DMT)-like permease